MLYCLKYDGKRWANRFVNIKMLAVTLTKTPVESRNLCVTQSGDLTSHKLKSTIFSFKMRFVLSFEIEQQLQN